ncbi:MAG: putative membrane protein affecting hemolysin expression [Oceanicoccus sp.]|jgi:uncharacterized membrane protein affecting hemolysin expression
MLFKQHILDKFLGLTLANKAAFTCATLSLLTSTILVIASLQTDRQLIRQSAELFGDSIVKQLARDASNPLVQGDKLSLQSLLNKLVESPIVLRSSIYDLENNSIAAAGVRNSKGLSLSASITFQDSIAGYAVITLDSTPLQQQASAYTRQLALLALLLAAACFVLGRIPGQFFGALLMDLAAICGIEKPQQRANSRINYRGRDELQYLAKQLIKGPAQQAEQRAKQPKHRAILVVKVSNIADLQQRFNSAQGNQLLQNLQQRLQLICKLYEGQLDVYSSDSFCLQFYAGDNSDSQNNNTGKTQQSTEDHPFRAICAGLLIKEWAQSMPIRLASGLSLFTDKRGDDHNDLARKLALQIAIENSASLASDSNQLQAASTVGDHHSIKQRIEYRPQAEASEIIIDRLLAPYSTLLNRQLQALQ